MNEDEIIYLVNLHLGEYADLSGAVLYSGRDTISRGDFYLMSINPNGKLNPERDPAKGQPMNALGRLPETWSSYTRECWKSCGLVCSYQDQETKHVSPGHRNRHQKYVCELFDAMCIDPERVASTESIFAQSPSQTSIGKICEGINAEKWWEMCWRVHKEFLARVRPKWVVAMGSLPFTFLHGEADKESGSAPHVVDAGERWNRRRTFRATFDLGSGREPLSVQVLGIYHPAARGMGPPAIGPDLRTFIRDVVLAG